MRQRQQGYLFKTPPRSTRRWKRLLRPSKQKKQNKNNTKDERTLETSTNQLLIIQVTPTITQEDTIFHLKTILQALPGCQ